jgi:hypothetical protein
MKEKKVLAEKWDEYLNLSAMLNDSVVKLEAEIGELKSAVAVEKLVVSSVKE